jgi:hypothetical protein
MSTRGYDIVVIFHTGTQLEKIGFCSVHNGVLVLEELSDYDKTITRIPLTSIAYWTAKPR